METSLTEQLRNFIYLKKGLTDSLSWINERIKFLIQARSDLNIEIQSLNRERELLKIEKQRPLRERAEWNFGAEIQGLESKIELKTIEIRDLDKVIKEYKGQQLLIWNRINIIWKKQYKIWKKINPSTFQVVNE